MKAMTIPAARAAVTWQNKNFPAWDHAKVKAKAGCCSRGAPTNSSCALCFSAKLCRDGPGVETSLCFNAPRRGEGVRLPFYQAFGNSFRLSAMGVDSGAGGGTGSARRRRERRLLQFLRHDRLSLALALSVNEHHTSRGQRKDRAGGEAREVLHAPRSGSATPLHPTPRVPGHPVWVSRGGHRNGSQMRTMEQLADVVPMVQILDIPVPQMVEQLADIMRFFDTLVVPEQVIEVPKIPAFRCPCAHRRARSAAGGTAGGSADDRIIILVAADCGAARRHSSSWRWRTKFWSSRFFLWTEFNSDAFLSETLF